MSAIDDLRKRLAGARSAHAAARTAYLRAREALGRTDGELRQLARTFDPKNPKHVEKRRTLEARRAEEARAVETALAGKRTALGNITEGLRGVTALGEPEDVAATLGDGHPILLFPLRIETRFKKVTPPTGAAPSDELWIRIYPDDCQIESFTEILSESELGNVKSFWTDFWAAGGVEDQERAAWRSLVNAHGAGRAGWLVGRLQPANPADQPDKTDPSDLLLVLPADAQLNAAQEAATRAFWTAWWKAGDDAAARNAAVAALSAAVGGEKTAYIRKSVVPPNIGAASPVGKARDEIRVETVFIRFPGPDTLPLSSSSWLQAPAVRTLPERLVILGFRAGTQVLRAVTDVVSEELHVGPDPSLPDDKQMKHVDGDLEVNEELRWMVDFDAAIAKGLGKKIPITAQDADRGYDALLVIGLRCSTGPAAGAAELERLLANHFQGNSGFAIVPQGTPTNNTEGAGAGYHSLEDADVSFDVVFKQKEAFTETTDELARADGQWLAAALGISPTLLKKVPNAAGRDQSEARAMNTALWPATWGYFLEEMMASAVSRADVAATRAFFTRFVSGRGALPAIRIGRQPYGLLPATAFSRLAFADGGDGAYLNKLHGVLGQLDAHWNGMAEQVSTVTRAGDPHQLLLDVVGLHPGSVEFHQRYAQSFQQMYNALLLQHREPWASIFAAAQDRARIAVMSAAGLPAGTRPPILDKYFLEQASLLKGDVVDDQPLSESRAVRPYTADERNYLRWLADSSLETVRLQDFGGRPPPTALLYLWLRHALMLSYWDGGLTLYEAVGLATSRQEPAFIHVQAGAGGTSSPPASESKWTPLYRAAPAITGSADLTVADYLSRTDVLGRPELRDLGAVKDALDLLAKTPTARLERLFVEHLDCCHYRLDAWKNGLTAARLFEMRGADNGAAGLHTGAYGWLENVRSENKTLTPVKLAPELAAVFQKPGEAVPMQDDANAGFIHAPSIGQATAAAVLRSAYLSASGPEAEEAYSIDLGSERVRRAQALLEGIRNGQGLSALLGYQFERGLHDAHGLAEVDKFIYPLRKAFPLVADQMKDTVTSEGTAIDVIEARNVLDGLKLVNHLKTATSKTYPFDRTDLPPADGSETAAISAQVARLLDSNDAVGDLVLAESVYQVVQGNFDRAAAHGDAISKGGYPPEIEVVKTPRTGRALTHRLALHFDTSVNPEVSVETGLDVSARALAEAPVNAWLFGVLPKPGDIGCRIAVTSHVDGSVTGVTVTAKALGLQPIDLLLAASVDSDQAMTELDDRIWYHLRYVAPQHPLDDFKIEYMVPAATGGVSFFQVGALLRSLRAVLLKSRPLGPEQMAITQEASGSDLASGGFDTAELAARIETARGKLAAHATPLTALGGNTTDGIEVFVKKVADELLAVAMFGLPQTSPGFLFAELAAIFRTLTGKVRALLARWDGRIAAYDDLVGQLAAAAADDERLEFLAQMETKVSASATSPRPTSVAAYQGTVEARRLALDQLYTRFRDHLSTGAADLEVFMTALLADVGQIPTFDSVRFDPDAQTDDLAAERKRIAALRTLAQEKARLLAADILTRSDDATARMKEADDATADARRVELLLAAGKRVLGDEIPLLPRFKLVSEQGDELALAFADSGQLLAHQRTTLGNRFPVDDWLYGIARVKDKMFHWENVAFLSAALGSVVTPDLTPAQLPYQPLDSWLALPYPAGYAFENEKLLYTAHLARPFDKAVLQAGILVEEWTEVIPNRDEVTGLAFHYDQPNTEPPQVMLLLVPPTLTGAWKWADVVDGIRETFDMAHKRAVEPAQLDAGPHGQLLPATIMAVTLHQITIGTNLAVSNGVYDDIARLD